MWLLNCSNYRLEPNNLDSPSSKPYWILSHTWGDDEVTFQDMQNLSVAAQKKGFRKIEAMCKLALSIGCDHVWIDTCCIDKTSSAELSESINSMFYWYKKAARCIAFLEDLEPGNGIAAEDDLRDCRWFTRGWTLQELIAPLEVWFYDACWRPRGSRTRLCRALSAITKIGEELLAFRGFSGFEDDVVDKLQRVPVAARMSWAAGRQTTRIEDKAYCLLGIFDVHMPLLYGEREQAFLRLQQTIAQKVDDMSLFAWIAGPHDGDRQPSGLYSGLLARDPAQFVACAGLVRIHDPLLPSPSWAITNAGVEITTALDSGCDEKGYTSITRAFDGSIRNEVCDPVLDSFCYRLFLHCQFSSAPTGLQNLEGLAIFLRKTTHGFVRYRPTELCSVKRFDMYFDDPRTIRISMTLTPQQHNDVLDSFNPDPSPGLGPTPNMLCIHWNVISRDTRVAFTYHPDHLWDREQLCLTRSRGGNSHVDNLGIGLVEITISGEEHSQPFTTTCWALCGAVLGSREPHPRPWIEFACEEDDGSVPLFRGHRHHRSRLTNPYALSTIFAVLQQSVRLGLDVASGVCIVSCTSTRRLKLSASRFERIVLDDNSEGWLATVTLEELGPSVGPPVGPCPGNLPPLAP